MRNIYLDYNRIGLRVEQLQSQIGEEAYDGIVILMRGGAFIGLKVAHEMGIPYYLLSYHRETRTATWYGPSIEHSRVLLCEDFAGKGNTLIDCRAFLENEMHCIVDTFVICKDTFSASVPNYFCFELRHEDARFVLPWERHSLNLEPTSNEVITAYDLDGVFLDDIPSEEWAIGVHHALAIRDIAPARSNLPSYGEHDVIVTGRPTMDFDRTLKWLRRHGINLPLYTRDDSIPKPTTEQAALWKGQKALSLGCRRYVESDAAQAAFMSKYFPELQVYWWNEGCPMLLFAA